MSERDATHCYIGTWPACGCVRFVTVDAPEHAKDNAKEIAKLVRAGYAVNRVTIEEFRSDKTTFGCKDEAACPNPWTKKKRRAA